MRGPRRCKNLEQAGWPAAAEYRRLLDERKAQAAPARSAADEELLRKLKHELGNFYDMLNRYASAEVYLVYRSAGKRAVPRSRPLGPAPPTGSEGSTTRCDADRGQRTNERAAVSRALPALAFRCANPQAG